jgi:hypothetical protein
MKQHAFVITGSRGWSDATLIRDRAEALPPKSLVICGGAEGADINFENAARSRGHTVVLMRAQWAVDEDTPSERIRTRRDGTQYDAYAGFARNEQMLDALLEVDCDERLVIAFWLGTSRGTKHTIEQAMRRGLPVEIHWRPVPVRMEADGDERAARPAAGAQGQ